MSLDGRVKVLESSQSAVALDNYKALVPVQVFVCHQQCLVDPICAALEKRNSQLVKSPIAHQLKNLSLSEIFLQLLATQAGVLRVKIKIIEPCILDFSAYRHSRPR